MGKLLIPRDGKPQLRIDGTLIAEITDCCVDGRPAESRWRLYRTKDGLYIIAERSTFAEQTETYSVVEERTARNVYDRIRGWAAVELARQFIADAARAFPFEFGPLLREWE